MTEPLWRIPLAGYCDVCALPATGMHVFDEFRRIFHEGGWYCEIPNPVPPVNPMGFYRRAYQPRKKAA